MKQKKKDDIKQLKVLKRQDILEKIKKADRLSNGNILEDKKLVEKIQKELEADFIPELYDKTMAKMFGEKYYDAAEEDKEEIEQKGIDLNLMGDAEMNEDAEVDEDAYERALA